MQANLLQLLELRPYPPKLIQRILLGPHYTVPCDQEFDYDLVDYPLFWAVRNDDVMLLALLLEEGFTEENEQWDYDDTYLAVEAIEGNKLNILKFLDSRDANVEHKDAYTYAVENGYCTIVEFLRNRSPYLRDVPVAHLCFKSGNIRMLDTTYPTVDEEGRSPLFFASTINEVKYLQNLGYDINAKDNAGYTLFQVYCINNREIEFLRELIAAGADPTVLMPNGKTVWFYTSNSAVKRAALNL